MKRGIFIMDIADTHKKSQYPFFSPWVSRPGISPSGGPDQNHVGRSEIFSAYDDPKTLIQGLSYPILLHCNRVKKFLVQLVSTVLSHFEKGHVRACVNLIPSLPLHPCSLSPSLSRKSTTWLLWISNLCQTKLMRWKRPAAQNGEDHGASNTRFYTNPFAVSLLVTFYVISLQTASNISFDACIHSLPIISASFSLKLSPPANRFIR